MKKPTKMIALFSLCVAIVIMNLFIHIPNALASTEIKVTIDSEILQMDVSPVIIDGRTLVPVRAIFEKLEAEIHWNSESKTVTATKDNISIVLQIDNPIALLNNQEVLLDVAPKIIDSRTLVPLRFVAESLNMDVDWKADTKTIVINSKPPVNLTYYENDFYRLPIYNELYEYEYENEADGIGIKIDENNGMSLVVMPAEENFDYFANVAIGLLASAYDLQSSSTIEHNSKKAYEALFRGEEFDENLYLLSPNGDNIEFFLKLLISQDDLENVYIFICVATIDKFDELLPIYNDFVNSIEFLNENIKAPYVGSSPEYETIVTSIFSLQKNIDYLYDIDNDTIHVHLDDKVVVSISLIEEDVIDLEPHYDRLHEHIEETFNPSIIELDTYYYWDYFVYELYFDHTISSSVNETDSYTALTEMMIFLDNYNRYILITYTTPEELFSEYYDQYLELLDGFDIIYLQNF